MRLYSKSWIPLLFCTALLTSTTFLANVVGMDTGVSPSRAWDDADGSTRRALLSFGYQYLESYGVTAFASAFAIAYYLAR